MENRMELFPEAGYDTKFIVLIIKPTGLSAEV